MNNVFAWSTWFAKVMLLLTGATLTACSKAEIDIRSKLQPAGWQSFCIDRVLVSMLPDLEISGSSIAVNGAHSYVGVGNFGANGIVYAGRDLAETHVAKYEQYRYIARYVSNSLPTSKTAKDGGEGVQQMLKYYKDKLREAGPNEAAALRETIRELEAQVKSALRKQTSTGVAKMSSPDMFAVRDYDNFKGGFIDRADMRVRLISGEITDSRQSAAQYAASLVEDFRKKYRVKPTAEIPTDKGFCTAHGFISEAGEPEADTKTEILFRSQKYPGLIFRLLVEPAEKRPVDDISSERGMAVDHADLHLVGIKDQYGPKRVNLLGASGRVIGYAYGKNCSETSCRPPDQLYAFEAETYGQIGRLDRPRIVLHMSALTSDEYKSRLPDVAGSSYNKIMRPALVGTPLPSYDEGRQIFEQVLHSIRLR